MTSGREHKWHIIISAEAGYIFKIIKMPYGARSDRIFLLNVELLHCIATRAEFITWILNCI